MIENNTLFNVKNRSSSIVMYRIPETNVQREFAPGEVKRINFHELEQLTYQTGGRELLENFLQIMEESATNDLNVHREPEYNMSESQIRDLLVNGSLDAFLDALDFAPIGVIDLIKVLSIQLPLTDLNKRRALKDKTGFDVDTALRHMEEERIESQKLETREAAPTRRVKEAAEAPAAPARRTVPKYKVVETKSEDSVTE